MPRHPDFKKIYNRFTKQYGSKKGKKLYYAWLNKHGYKEESAFPKKKEKKEKQCCVRGVEIKEIEGEYHVEGLIATSHIDSLDLAEDIDIPDMIPKETLEAFAEQINSNEESRLMGVHHSEGKPINAEYYGKADIEVAPAKVVELSDGELGLYVDTKLLKEDAMTPEIIKEFESGELNSFSITYDTKGFMTADFEWVDDKLVRILKPETKLYGYTAASDPVNPNAVAVAYGFKEFKELIKPQKNKMIEEVNKMVDMDKKKKKKELKEEEINEKEEQEEEAENVEENKEEEKKEESEQKEFQKWKDNKAKLEQKELIENATKGVVEKMMEKMEVKEKVLKGSDETKDIKELPLEIKEYRAVIEEGKDCKIEIKEQFRKAAAYCDQIDVDWREKTTAPAEGREYKAFRTNGRFLEYKGLGLTTNQNSDTDYLQSTAELQDVYDPLIYNALNQETTTWGLLAKDDYSKKGNNQVQFVLKTAANTTAAFYPGNSVTTGNVTRLKYQTKFKKAQVGVSIDGDMIAAARGGPVSDVFAQEVMDSAMDLLEVINAALFAEVGLETASAIIGFEYITDSAANTTLYNLTRSTTNKLAPDAAGDTYINQSSAVISMGNLRKARRQATTEGAKKRNLVYITSPTQGDMLRGKFDDARRMLTARNTDFGFSTDLFIDGVPVFEDIDCNTDDWWLVDLESHRVGIWIPPTLEKLGKTADSEDAFIKTYFATYNRRPRAMVQIYGCATS